jgi:hypothetical protein
MTDVRQASQMGRLVREACDEAATVPCEDACRCGGGEARWARGTPVAAMIGWRGQTRKERAGGCWARRIVVADGGECSQLAHMSSSGALAPAPARFGIAALSVGSPPAATWP